MQAAPFFSTALPFTIPSASSGQALAHPPGAMAPPPTAADLQREMQRETARADAAKPAPPNFLFIYTDDQRYDAVSVVQQEQGARARAVVARACAAWAKRCC